jgi:hypothetical protein
LTFVLTSPVMLKMQKMLVFRRWLSLTAAVIFKCRSCWSSSYGCLKFCCHVEDTEAVGLVCCLLASPFLIVLSHIPVVKVVSI